MHFTENKKSLRMYEVGFGLAVLSEESPYRLFTVKILFCLKTSGNDKQSTMISFENCPQQQ